MTPQIPGFDVQDVPLAAGRLRVATGGAGPAVLLLHGFPQTHLAWRGVAPLLAERFRVVCPDLPGYGASAPAASYAKRTTAATMVALMRELGHDRFALVGHDRGALVAFRAGLDHPETVTQLGILDVVPTLDMWGVLHGLAGAVGYHLYLMAQPEPLPETLIGNSADVFFGSFLDAWGKDPDAVPAAVRAEYLRASAAAVPSIVADYRASAGIDVTHDQADHDAGSQLAMPVTVIQQDWGAQLGFDAAALWRAWAPDLDHRLTEAGHFMAEEAPDEIAAAITELVAR
jgi:haloacetate dehalogenase